MVYTVAEGYRVKILDLDFVEAPVVDAWAQLSGFRFVSCFLWSLGLCGIGFWLL